MAIQTAEVLKQDALFRAGELTDGTSPYDSKALAYINQIYRSILAGGNEFNVELGSPWSWARSEQPGTVVLQPKYDSGTISVTNSNSTVTFSSAPAISLAGQWLKIIGRPEFFRITSHVAAAATAIIDTPYTDATGSGLSYEVYFLEYDLPVPIERMIAPMVVQRQQEFTAPKDGMIYQVDLANIDEVWPLKQIPEEIPQSYAVINKDPDGNMRVRFNAQAGEQTRVSFDYIPVYGELVELDILSVDVDFANDLFNVPNHGLKNGSEVIFSSVAAGMGLSINTRYFVVGVTLNTFQVSTVLNGSAVDLLAAGAVSLSSVPILPKAFREILSYGAAAFLMTDKNDERAQAYFALCTQKMNALIKSDDRELAQSGGGRLMQFIPRMDMHSGPRRYWRQEPS